MASFIKFANGNIFDIEDESTLDNIIHSAKDVQDGLNFVGAITADNVQHVEFYMNASNMYELNPTYTYNDLLIDSINFDTTDMVVYVYLRNKTAVEKRLDAIAEEQELQNEAIDFLIMA